jgi:transcription initiation factor TFIIE subunit alpha
MELTIHIDEDVLKKVSTIIGGEEAARVVIALKELGEATDDQILVKTGTKLNDVRKILFKLYNHSIVQCDRIRDEKTGWFIFHWKLQPDQVDGYIKNQKKRIRKILETRLDNEIKHDFYYCYNPSCNRVTFEDAMELVFRCPNCGNPLQHYDNSKIVDVLKERIDKLDKESKE